MSHLIRAFPFEHLLRETADCAPSGSRSCLGLRDRVIYSQDAAAMCHDVGAPLTAGTLF